ncbi:GNAT superfamily N-acetyltransferase [Mycetocola sp. BIGb0189]|uniref:GNAT family N-acetyltransferase n=1 Tax=Mycetocola sp. BIGb0189 TaxID=2940604 RepID=UPI00216956C4|nr:GNAT family N-acetyltransferase [Mycetocola sp. BIGb0189]MCS4276487.1 GNAT superfamily N-acetyltransferase [Mycetocola sp. BIGb0189]
MNWLIEDVPWEDVDGANLRLAQRAELDARYGSDDHEPGHAPTADEIPVFLVAHDEAGAAIACGGLRSVPETVFGPGYMEIKRMYVAPAARGTGISTAMLHRLEDAARALGAHRMVLETGERQPDAIRFYTREGYAQIPGFGDYAGAFESVCFGRDLAPRP